MTRIAETVPELWFNRRGYMTVRGLKPEEGHGEIDLLAYHPRKRQAVHVETSASLDPRGFLGGENAAHIARGIKKLVADKYEKENIKKVRNDFLPEDVECAYMLVHGKLKREEQVRKELEANKVTPVSLHKILRELQTPVNTEKVPFEVDTDAAYFAGLAHYYHLREFQEEQELLERAKAGATVVVSMREGVHSNVVKWAREAGKFVRIDRKSKWGNSFKAGKDGTREEVIAKYERYLLEERQDLLERLPELTGKVLGCWCAPEPCHGDVLLRLAEAY